jgi:hypothetical protein
MTRKWVCGYLLIAGLLTLLPALAATPPSLVNYQGVLRNQNGAPLSGAFDMVLRFMDAQSGGTEILIDRHVTSNAVIVSDGLFNVTLGSGTIIDGSGPGTYTALEEVFRDYGNVWLEVQVGGETLSPRTPIRSAPFALNATRLEGRSASGFIDASATPQTKLGRLTVTGGGGFQTFEPALSAENFAGGMGLYAYGEQSGVSADGGFDGTGVFSSGRVGGDFQGGEVGLRASGSNGGEFAGDYFGVWATNNYSDGAAGYFDSPNASAELASVNTGVEGNCAVSGGFGVAGYGDRVGVRGVANGVHVSSAIGGSFDGNGAFSVGVSARGVTGGRFSTSADPGLSVTLAGSGKGVDVSGGGTGSVGVQASAGARGGSFTANEPGSFGVHATGQAHGGFFQNAGGEYAHVASQGVSISGVGPTYGSYFANGSPWFSYAYVPAVDLGILAWGPTAGGQFNNFSTSSYALVGYSSYKIEGNGAVSFVQNHPDDPSKVIVYAAPEGDEVAVYTRGSGKLVDGEARVKLGETFARVTNPDIGLTATATPRGEPIPLAIDDLGTGGMIVRGPAGSNAAFDYMVWGLRIGFEEQSIVQPKQRESKIPSMHEHESFFQQDPSLRSHTALARFTGMEEAVHGRSQVNLERAHRLRDAVGVFAQGSPLDERKEGPGRLEPPFLPGGAQPATALHDAADPRPAAARPVAAPTGPPDRQPRVDPDLFDTLGAVRVGDVVSLVSGSPGAVALSAGPDDALVIGCAQASEAAGPGRIAVATSRIALCRVDASFGAVAVGDALIASPVPGTAMGAAAAGAAAAAVLGRAIDPLESGADVIRVLLGAR